MKHILPILTITTLAAAASAQTAAAAPAGLSYNRVTVSRQGQNNSISASALLGSTNVLATIGSSIDNGGYNSTSFGLGYVFKNVAFGTDATVGITTGNNNQNTAVSVNLRRALNEVVSGLEIAAGVSFSENADSGANPKGSTSVVTAELAYNINKTWSVAYGISNTNPVASVGYYTSDADVKHIISVRHNF